MSNVKVALGAALACIATLGIGSASLAQQKTETSEADASDSELPSQTTEKAMLEALLKRRAETAGSAGSPESKRAALDFLDRRIAEVRSRIE